MKQSQESIQKLAKNLAEITRIADQTRRYPITQYERETIRLYLSEHFIEGSSGNSRYISIWATYVRRLTDAVNWTVEERESFVEFFLAELFSEVKKLPTLQEVIEGEGNCPCLMGLS
ncbi:MAG: hypothetical protein OEV93_01525 [Candidatus Moranbacteria bacterium]|nr:hypothetical protein [Candidatus Moranbacteria bacterium]